MKYVIRISFVLVALTASLAYGESFVSDFLSIDCDLISSALGRSNFAEGGATAVFGNPARTNSPGPKLFASHEGFYGNLIISDAVGALVPLRKRNLALGVIYLGGGGINITELPDPSQPVGPDNLPYIVDTKGHHDLALGAAYAYSLNRGISLGASGGGVYRSLIDQKAYGVFVSLGLDWAPIQNMHLGFIVANSSYISWSTGTNELRTPDISTGCSFNKDLGSNFSSKVTAELSYVISGALLEYSVGAGISYKSMVDFMAGLDDGSITAGADFALFPGILIGASMTTHRELPVSYRFGINLYKADSNND